jgi:hypothetical protein
VRAREGRSTTAVLAQHEQALAKTAKDDTNSEVRAAAAEALAKLQAGK